MIKITRDVIHSFLILCLFLLIRCHSKKNGSNHSLYNYATTTILDSSQVYYDYSNYRILDTIPPPIWMNLKKHPKSYDIIDYDEIEFSNIRFMEFAPVFFDKSGFFETQVNNVNVTEILNPCRGESLKKKVKYLRFGSGQYIKVNETVYLEEVDMRIQNAIMYIDSLELNNATTREFIAEKFPNSFKWRNFGVNWVPSLLEPQLIKTFSFLTIRDSNSKNLLRLNFLNNKLFYCDFIYECM